MEAASFYAGVRHKRYSGQQEKAPNKKIRLVIKLDGFYF
jgi:hypothetical protein